MDERDFTVYQIHSVGFKPSGLAQQWIWFLSDPSLIFIIDSSWKTSGQLPPATLFYPSRKSPEGSFGTVWNQGASTPIKHSQHFLLPLRCKLEVLSCSECLCDCWCLWAPNFHSSLPPWLSVSGQRAPTWAPLNLPIFFRHSSILCLCLFLLKNHFTVLVGTRPKIQTFKLFFTLSLPNLTFYIKSVMWEWFPRRM